MVFNFKDHEIFMAVLPLFHIFGLTTSFWLPIIRGYSIIAQPNPLEYQQVADNIRKYNATCISATPTFFRGYLKKSQTNDFKSLTMAISGGDKLAKPLVNEFFEKHNVMIYEGYGTTETSPVISTNTPNANKLGSIGKPLPNVKVKIVGVDTPRELLTNDMGKILVQGSLVMNGYLDDPNESTLRINDGWYDTGDMGLIDKDGFLWYKGRLRRFVKIGGEMISLAAVEEEAGKVISSLCCAVEIPNKVKGSEIVLVVTKQIEQKKITKALKESIGSIAVPTRFVYLDELPIMSNGKVDFRTTTKICHEKLYKQSKKAFK
jgi:acyl-[acyl-carrier-protein]-phospholipid O-acyltransferase/long-chain-fatty-acid--[acyl-carrier-protein] ligase